MRIISGLFKGRRVRAPKKLPSRPTTDMAKEGLFNILYNKYDFQDIEVLDLFSGTGNISYEFCSRGVKLIQSVDKDRRCVEFIKKTAKDLNMPIQAVEANVYSFLQKNNRTFDVIFADPPYKMELENFKKLIYLIFTNKLINENGICIIEHSKHKDLSKIDNFKEIKCYSGNCFSFFK